MNLQEEHNSIKNTQSVLNQITLPTVTRGRGRPKGSNLNAMGLLKVKSKIKPFLTTANY